MYCFLLNRLLTFHWQAFGEYFLKHFLIENDYGIVSENAGYPSPSNPASSPALTACVSVRVCGCAHACTYSCPTLWPHRLWPTRLLFPWKFPGKNTAVGSHFLFLTHWLDWCLLHLLNWQAGSFHLVPSILYVIDAQTELGEEKQAQKIMPWGSISLAFITCMVF